MNVPDIVNIHGIFESVDTGAASAPKMTLSSLTSASTTTAELIIGDTIIGQVTNAVAIVAEKVSNSSSQIVYIYKNDITFKEGEVVVFQESNTQGTVTTLDTPSFDISSDYTYGSGQESTFYDYGIVKRKSESDSPT